MVERLNGIQEVTGPNPVFSTTYVGSSMVELRIPNPRVAGSSPVSRASRGCPLPTGRQWETAKRRIQVGGAPQPVGYRGPVRAVFSVRSMQWPRHGRSLRVNSAVECQSLTLDVAGSIPAPATILDVKKLALGLSVGQRSLAPPRQVRLLQSQPHLSVAQPGRALHLGCRGPQVRILSDRLFT